jgi:cytosine/adenosine deaminase-related metal-dependent hydrolase
MNDCGNQTPLEMFLGAPGGRALPRWIVAHLNELAKSDFELLQKSKEKFHVVHSPRSHAFFNHSRFPFERLRALGLNICLGTDSLASNQSLSLFAEMRAFQKESPQTSPEEILQMVTVNPASALQQQNALGRISRGFRADLTTIPNNETRNLFEDVVAFDGTVDWVMVDGKIQRVRELACGQPCR